MQYFLLMHFLLAYAHATWRDKLNQLLKHYHQNFKLSISPSEISLIARLDRLMKHDIHHVKEFLTPILLDLEAIADATMPIYRIALMELFPSLDSSMLDLQDMMHMEEYSETRSSRYDHPYPYYQSKKISTTNE